MTVTTLERTELPIELDDLELPCDRIERGLCRVCGIATWVVQAVHGCTYLYCDQCRLDMLQAFSLSKMVRVWCKCGVEDWGTLEETVKSIHPL